MVLSKPTESRSCRCQRRPVPNGHKDLCDFHPSAESATDLWEQFFRRLVSFFHLTAAREDGATQDVAVLKLDSSVSVLEAIRQTIVDSNLQDRYLLSIAQEVEELRSTLAAVR